MQWLLLYNYFVLNLDVYHLGCPVASFAKEVNLRLAKRPLVFNGRLANRGLTSFVKKATGDHYKNAYELLNLMTLKFSALKKILKIQCMGKIFYVEFQRVPYLYIGRYDSHTTLDLKSSYI